MKEDLTALLQIKHQNPSELEAHLSTFEEQLNQLEQMASERNTSQIQNTEIQTPYQVNPDFIPSDSTSDYLIKFESEPTPIHLSQNPEFEHEEQDIKDVLELQFSSQSYNDLILETSHPSNSEAISSSDQRRPNPIIFLMLTTDQQLRDA